MSAHTEKRMREAILAHFADEGERFTDLRALEVRAVTNNGDLASGERLFYRAGQTYTDLLLLAAPAIGTGASEPLQIRNHTGV